MKKIVKYGCYALLAVCFFRCTPLDTDLDGKILTDKEGNVYKLEWQQGKGATWAFKYPVKVITQQGDTTTEWRYYR